MTDLNTQLSASLAYEKLKKSEAYQGIHRACRDCELVYDQAWETPAERVLAGAIRAELIKVLAFAQTLAADLSVKTVGLKRPMIVGPIGNDQ